MGHRLTSKPVPGDWNGVIHALMRLDHALNTSASPIFENIGLTGLTENALMYADSSGVITSLAAATNGQLIIGSTGAVPSVAALTGTANQVTITNAAGSITLSTPQDIHAAASPTFANLSLGTGELTAGSVNRASGTLTLEIGGTAEISITSSAITFGGNLVIPDDGYVGSVSDTDAIQINSTGNAAFTQIARGIFPVAGDDIATKEYVDLAIGSSFDLFLSDTDDGVIADTHVMYPMETGEAESTENSPLLSDGPDKLAFSWLSEAGVPGTDTLREGVYDCHIHLKKNSGGATTTVYWKLSYVDANGSSNKTLVTTSETTGGITTSEEMYDIHAVVSSPVPTGATKRLFFELYANIGTGQDVTLTITMEGDHDSHVSFQVPSSVWQHHGDVLDDLNTLGVVASDGQFIVGTGAGTFAYESPATVLVTLSGQAGAAFDWNGQNLTSVGTITSGSITILDTIPILVFRDSDSLGSASVGYIEWRDSGGGRAGFLGNNSAGNDDLYWKNEQGGNIGIETTGAGELQILADTVITGTLSSGVITQSGATLANTYQPVDAGLTSLAGLTYAAASFVKMTGANAFALRTIAETADDLEGTIDHNSLANTHEANIFKTIVVSGQSNIVADSDTDTLTLVAGTNITLTTDAGTDSITITSAGGGANHNILDGSVHSDSVADGVTRGSIIYGNATPKWDELVLGAANTFLGSNGTDLSYRTAAQVMASLSGSAAAAFDLNGQDLTNGGVLFLTEQAAAEANIAGKGQFWVKTATPNEPYFDDDTGIEIPLDNRFVSRTSPGSTDFEIGDFITDETWRDLDLSGIIDVNAVCVVLTLKIQQTALGSYVAFRKKGDTDAFTAITTRIQSTTIAFDNSVVVPCSSDRKIQYLIKDVVWTTVRATVSGWWLA